MKEVGDKSWDQNLETEVGQKSCKQIFWTNNVTKKINKSCEQKLQTKVENKSCELNVNDGCEENFKQKL